MTFELLDQAWAQRLGWTLVHFLWQGAAVAGLLWVALRLLARRRPEWRYVAACAALTLMAAAPAATFFLVRPETPAKQPHVFAVFDENTRSASGLRIDFGTLPVDTAHLRREHLQVIDNKHGRDIGDLLELHAVGGNSVELRLRPGCGDFGTGNGVCVRSAGPLPLSDGRTWETPFELTCETDRPQAAVPQGPWGRVTAALSPYMPPAALAWLIGVLACSAWHAGGWLNVQRLRRGARPLMDDAAGAPWLDAAARLAETFRLRRAVQLRRAAELAGPVVVGVFRPAVLIPAAVLTGLTPRQIEAILAHELAHVRRHDYLVNLLQAVVETLLFYHPGVWWVSSRIRTERENCCDDLAATAVGDRRTYAEALAALADVIRAGTPPRRSAWARLAPAVRRHAPTDRLAPRAVPPGASRKLLPRIRRLVGLQNRISSRWTAALAGALVLSGLLIGAVFYGCKDNASPPPENAAATTQPATQPATKPSDTFDVKANAADLRGALDLLSKQGDKNIVLLKGVKGTVTINLREVTFDQTLYAITQSQGLDYKEQDGIIYVGTPEQIRTLRPMRQPATQPADETRGTLDRAAELARRMQATRNLREIGRGLEMYKNTADDYPFLSNLNNPADPNKPLFRAPSVTESTTQPAGREHMTFGPVIEQVVNHTGENCLIDFDTASLVTPPKEAFEGGSETATAWTRKNGIDAGGGTQPEVRGLIAFDIIAFPVDNKIWDLPGNAGLSADKRNAFAAATPGNPVFLSAKGSVPVTYKFQTREGGLGLLQITGFTDKPKGTKIRYKMLRPASTTQPAKDLTEPSAGRLQPETIAQLKQLALDHPTWKGPLSKGLKVRVEADTWEELVAKAKPALTWGKPEYKPMPDCGFPDMMWIENNANGRPVFRIARAYTWKPDGQKTRWVLADIIEGDGDSLLREQIGGLAMPETLPVLKEKPEAEHPVSYAIAKSSYPAGGTVYEIGWALHMCEGTGHWEPRRLLYVWHTPDGRWKLIGEGPEENRGRTGDLHHMATTRKSTVRWVGNPPRPVISFVRHDMTIERGDEQTGQPGRPIITTCREATLDATADALPAALQWHSREYVIVEKNRTRGRVLHDLQVWGHDPNTILRLNPQLPRDNKDVVAEGTQITLRHFYPSGTTPLVSASSPEAMKRVTALIQGEPARTPAELPDLFLPAVAGSDGQPPRLRPGLDTTLVFHAGMMSKQIHSVRDTFNSPSTMLYSIADRNVFYVGSFDSSSHRYYGPFEGDPFVNLKLKRPPSPSLVGRWKFRPPSKELAAKGSLYLEFLDNGYAIYEGISNVPEEESRAIAGKYVVKGDRIEIRFEYGDKDDKNSEPTVIKIIKHTFDTLVISKDGEVFTCDRVATSPTTRPATQPAT